MPIHKKKKWPKEPKQDAPNLHFSAITQPEQARGNSGENKTC